MDDTTQARVRRFRLTPGHLILGLLLAECLLWLSDRLGWPAWHKGYAVLTCVAAVLDALSISVNVRFGAAGHGGIADR